MSMFLPLSAIPIMFVSFYVFILNAHLIYKVLIKGHNVKIIQFPFPLSSFQFSGMLESLIAIGEK